mgnify:CR=1 FL=1
MSDRSSSRNRIASVISFRTKRPDNSLQYMTEIHTYMTCGCIVRCSSSSTIIIIKVSRSQGLVSFEIVGSRAKPLCVFRVFAASYCSRSLRKNKKTKKQKNKEPFAYFPDVQVLESLNIFRNFLFFFCCQFGDFRGFLHCFASLLLCFFVLDCGLWHCGCRSFPPSSSSQHLVCNLLATLPFASTDNLSMSLHVICLFFLFIWSKSCPFDNHLQVPFLMFCRTSALKPFFIVFCPPANQ